MKKLLFIPILFLCTSLMAQEVIVDYEESSLPVLNEELRQSRYRLDTLENATTSVSLTSEVTGILPLANGGTGEALADPGADRILFWDDSESEVTFLIPGTNLSITGTTLNAVGSSSGVEIFTADGTFTSNSDTTRVWVYMVGGGGGGGKDANGGGGGGGGASLWTLSPINISASTSYVLQVGVGGPGATVANGTAGESSIFDTGGIALTTLGGDGGAGGLVGSGGVATAATAPGTAAQTVGGVIGYQVGGIAGGDGGSPNANNGGGGGGTLYGVGANGGAGAGVTPTANSGAGGSGGGNNTNGGAGADGIIIIVY